MVDEGVRLFATDQDQVCAALVEAQKAIGPIPKNQSVSVRTEKGSYSYTYADLPSIMEAVKEPLYAQGLGITHMALPCEGGVRVRSRLVHKSGQELVSDLTMGTKQTSPQAVGSLLSYAKRYNVGLLLGLAAEEDDDGTLAQGLAGRATKAPKTAKKAPKSGTKGSPTPPPDPKDPLNNQGTGGGSGESQGNTSAPAQDKSFNQDALTQGQLKSIFTQLTNKGMKKADLKAWLVEQGLQVESSKDIPKTWANKILEWIDSQPNYKGADS